MATLRPSRLRGAGGPESMRLETTSSLTPKVDSKPKASAVLHTKEKDSKDDTQQVSPSSARRQKSRPNMSPTLHAKEEYCKPHNQDDMANWTKPRAEEGCWSYETEINPVRGCLSPEQIHDCLTPQELVKEIRLRNTDLILQNQRDDKPTSKVSVDRGGVHTATEREDASASALEVSDDSILDKAIPKSVVTKSMAPIKAASVKKTSVDSTPGLELRDVGKAIPKSVAESTAPVQKMSVPDPPEMIPDPPVASSKSVNTASVESVTAPDPPGELAVWQDKDTLILSEHNPGTSKAATAATAAADLLATGEHGSFDFAVATVSSVISHESRTKKTTRQGERHEISFTQVRDAMKNCLYHQAAAKEKGPTEQKQSEQALEAAFWSKCAIMVATEIMRSSVSVNKVQLAQVAAETVLINCFRDVAEEESATENWQEAAFVRLENVAAKVSMAIMCVKVGDPVASATVATAAAALILNQRASLNCVSSMETEAQSQNKAETKRTQDNGVGAIESLGHCEITKDDIETFQSEEIKGTLSMTADSILKNTEGEDAEEISSPISVKADDLSKEDKYHPAKHHEVVNDAIKESLAEITNEASIEYAAEEPTPEKKTEKGFSIQSMLGLKSGDSKSSVKSEEKVRVVGAVEEKEVVEAKNEAKGEEKTNEPLTDISEEAVEESKKSLAPVIVAATTTAVATDGSYDEEAIAGPTVEDMDKVGDEKAKKQPAPIIVEAGDDPEEEETILAPSTDTPVEAVIQETEKQAAPAFAEVEADAEDAKTTKETPADVPEEAVIMDTAKNAPPHTGAESIAVVAATVAVVPGASTSGNEKGVTNRSWDEAQEEIVAKEIEMLLEPAPDSTTKSECEEKEETNDLSKEPFIKYAVEARVEDSSFKTEDSHHQKSNKKKKKRGFSIKKALGLTRLLSKSKEVSGKNKTEDYFAAAVGKSNDDAKQVEFKSKEASVENKTEESLAVAIDEHNGNAKEVESKSKEASVTKTTEDSITASVDKSSDDAKKVEAIIAPDAPKEIVIEGAEEEQLVSVAATKANDAAEDVVKETHEASADDILAEAAFTGYEDDPSCLRAEAEHAAALTTEEFDTAKDIDVNKDAERGAKETQTIRGFTTADSFVESKNSIGEDKQKREEEFPFISAVAKSLVGSEKKYRAMFQSEEMTEEENTNREEEAESNPKASGEEESPP